MVFKKKDDEKAADKLSKDVDEIKEDISEAREELDEAEDNVEELSLDLSNFFKKKKAKKAELAETSEPATGGEIELDFSKIPDAIVRHKTACIYGVLLLILLMSFMLLTTPLYKFTGIYENTLSAMDPYAHYRRAAEIAEQGYPGTGVKIVDGQEVPWDYFHNAPEGAKPYASAYAWFIAYSYNGLAKYLFPTLLAWDRFTPALFGVLAVLAMYLLASQLFDKKTGLAAAFMFALSSSFLTRSVAGFADTDSMVSFLTIITFFFFIKAWDQESFIYAGFCGVSMAVFGLTWSYQFVPTLMLFSILFYFIFSVVKNLLLKRSPSIISAVKNHLQKKKKKYLVFILILLVGLGLITILRGPEHINVFSESIAATQRKASTYVDEGVRNVMLTVSEMNTQTPRQFVSSVHISAVFFGVALLLLLRFGLWEKLIKKQFHLIFLLLWLVSTFYMSLFQAVRFTSMFVIPFMIFVGLSIATMISTFVSREKPYTSVVVVVLLLAFLFVVPNITAGDALGPPYFPMAVAVVNSAGPSLGPTWINFFDWMRAETPEDSIFASWWDPGHAIEAIGERPAVADGAQNAYHVHDLALVFTSTNESEAVKILDEYNVSYFFTSSDLIGKYGAISFLSGRWEGGDSYPVMRLSETRQLQDGTLLIYNLGGGNSIMVNVEYEGVTATLRQGYQSQKIRRVFFYKDNTGMISTIGDNNTLDAMLYISPDYTQAFYMPPRLENNMLTRLHLFNGAGLEHFELVKNFGDQIKVYKIKY